MGYMRTKDSYVYVVAWDEFGIVKIGSTRSQRYRSFMIRGARLVWLGLEGGVKFEDWPGEFQYHTAALGLAGRAFQSRHEAFPFLGNGGGGYLECYQVTGTADEFWKACTSTVLKHDAQALPPRIMPNQIRRAYTSTCHARDARDGRTHADDPQSESISHLSHAQETTTDSACDHREQATA